MIDAWFLYFEFGLLKTKEQVISEKESPAQVPDRKLQVSYVQQLLNANYHVIHLLLSSKCRSFHTIHVHVDLTFTTLQYI